MAAQLYAGGGRISSGIPSPGPPISPVRSERRPSCAPGQRTLIRGCIRRNDEINVGIAVATDDGVSVAVVRNAAAQSVATIAAKRQALADRARANRSKPSDVAGATFTISNLGMRRVDAFTAIINPPQATILAVGSIVDRVVAVDGQPAVRPMVTMTLSPDHRVIDGARAAAAFMDDLATAIGDPTSWLK